MKNIILTVLVILTTFQAHAETTYERVVRTGVIKCGYMIWPPYFDRNVTTKKFSGMNYEYVEALGRNLNIKIDWAMELNFGDQVEALRTGKIDAICASEGPIMPSTTKYLTYSTPMIYVPFYLYARSDDNRFSGDAKKSINKTGIKISVIDGDISGQVARVQFPQAQAVSIPQMASPMQMMMDVTAKKADIVINEPLSMNEYLKQNKGSLKKIGQSPVAVIPNTLSFLRSDNNSAFVSMINQAIENLKNSGEEDMILAAILTTPNGEVSFFKTAKPYK